MNRPIESVIKSIRQTEGGGFVVRRPFPTQKVSFVDPFLLLDEMGPVDYAPGEAIGAPDHPHRGFETVSYILEGEMEHEDSAGHKGKLAAGDVQWMTAGAGVVHSEMPSARVRKEGGRVHGFQIWVNLPAEHKMMKPRYQEVPSAKMPEGVSEDGLARVKVVAGEALGKKAVIETMTPILYHDWTLSPGARVESAVPEGYDVMAYVFAGSVVAGENARTLVEGDLGVFGQGGAVTLAVPKEAKDNARLLLLGGVPIKEPVARYGPFVMNTEVEIRQAFLDYRFGKMGEIRR